MNIICIYYDGDKRTRAAKHVYYLRMLFDKCIQFDTGVIDNLGVGYIALQGVSIITKLILPYK